MIKENRKGSCQFKTIFYGKSTLIDDKMFDDVDIRHELDTCKQKCTQALNVISTFKGAEIARIISDKQFYSAIDQVYMGFGVFREYGEEYYLQYTPQIAQHLITSGALSIICRCYLNELNFLRNVPNKEEGDELFDSERGLLFYRVTIILNSYSDASKELCVKMCHIDNFIHDVVMYLESFHEKMKCKPDTIHDKEEQLCCETLGMLVNLTNKDDNLSVLRENHLPTILMRYATEDVGLNKHGQMRALIALSGLLTDDQSKALQAKETALRQLVGMISRAVKSHDLRSRGWTIFDLIHGLTKLAGSDATKIFLVEVGILPLLTTLLTSEKDKVREAVLDALLVLSFAEPNKDKILDDSNLINRLIEIWSLKEPCTQKIIEAIFWNLRDKIDSKPKNELLDSVLQNVVHTPSTTQKPKDGHVMISYNWHHQKVLLKVRDTLKENGYKVWMDVDDMLGAPLDEMASAIENSVAIVIAVSPKYKNSAYCRLECEYAFNSKKLLLPLKLEHHYKPDGWLGLVVSGLYYHDISEGQDFVCRMKHLMKALGSEGKGFDSVDGPILKATSSRSSTVPPPTSNAVKVATWSASDIEAWLTNNELNRFTELSRLSGAQIVFLWDVYKKAPESYFKWLDREFKIQALTDVMAFTGALTRLLS